MLILSCASETQPCLSQEKNMRDEINVVLFSDHGMTELKWMEKVIELDKYISMSNIVKMMDRGPVVSLWPKQDKFEEVRETRRFHLMLIELKTQSCSLFYLSF